MTITEIFKRFNAPWDVIELMPQSASLKRSGRYYGVVDKSESNLIHCVTLEDALVFARLPEMIDLVERVAEDETSKHQTSAKILLEMMQAPKKKRKKNEH